MNYNLYFLEEFQSNGANKQVIFHVYIHTIEESESQNLSLRFPKKKAQTSKTQIKLEISPIKMLLLPFF